MSEAFGKPYDLEERTFQFAKRVRSFIKRLPHTVANVEDARQLARASASVGANYIEANEALGKKDFKLHIRISRKESKESRFFCDSWTQEPTQMSSRSGRRLFRKAANY